MNLCRTEGRKEARFRGVAATAYRVRSGEAYGSQPPSPHVLGSHQPLNVQARSREAAASQDRDRGVATEARPQGTASSPRSLVARRQ